MSDTTLVSAANLCAFIAQAFAAVDMPQNAAQTVAELMTAADLAGADGHGIFRLPQYIRRIRANGVNVRPRIRTMRDSAATALLDGDNGMGHLVMHAATELAMDKAARAGIGWVGACNSNHAGAGSLYAGRVARRGYIGIYLGVGSANHMAPWGGTDLLLSTNPIAIAVPSPRWGVVMLDMATTVAAYGKVKLAAQRGESMPEGWMIDRQGRPLTDPKRSAEGLLLPIGGYKGYGLSLMIGLLAGTLNGAAMGSAVIDFNKDDASRANTGQSVLALDPRFFVDRRTFGEQVDLVIDEMKDSARLPGVDAIRFPGEQSEARRREREANGIPLGNELWKELERLAQGLGIAPL